MKRPPSLALLLALLVGPPALGATAPLDSPRTKPTSTSTSTPAPPPNPSGPAAPAEPPAAPRPEPLASPSARPFPPLDEEIARLTARTSSHPDDAAAWARLGDALMQRSRDRHDPSLLDRAEAAFRRVHSLDPRDTSGLVGLAWVANTRHDFDAGRRWARETLAVDPRHPDALALLGDAAVETGDYDEALDHYQASLDARPDLSSYSRAAHVLWLTGDSRRAQALMHRAIAAGGPHAENTAWCRAQLASMMFDEGSHVAAETMARRALQDSPENPHALAVLGRIRMGRKDYPAAIDLFERAAALLPQSATLAALVDAHTLHGDAEAAERAAARFLAAHRDHDHGHGHGHGDGQGHGHAGAPVPTEPHLPDHPTEPSPSHSHDHPHGDAELARFLADHDRELDRALHEAEDAYRKFKNVGVTDTLAWCYHQKGLDVDALRTIRRALRWNTPDATLHYHAGMIYARLGDRPSAQKHLYRALNLNPAFHPLHAEIASRTLTRLGSARTAAETEAAATIRPLAAAATPAAPGTPVRAQ